MVTGFFYKILKFCFINVHTGTGIYLKYEVYIKHILYSTIRNLVIGRSSHRDKKRRRKYVTACVQSKLHINKQNPIYFSGQTMYTLYSVSYYSIYVRCTSMFSMKGRQFRLTDLYTKWEGQFLWAFLGYHAVYICICVRDFQVYIQDIQRNVT